MLASVAGEVSVVAVDHRQAGAHVAREVEGRDSGTKSKRRERVPEIVDPPHRIDTRRLLRRPPLERAEVMDVDVAAPLTGEQQRRAVAVLDPVERVERPRLQRHRSHARFGSGTSAGPE